LKNKDQLLCEIDPLERIEDPKYVPKDIIVNLDIANNCREISQKKPTPSKYSSILFFDCETFAQLDRTHKDI